MSPPPPLLPARHTHDLRIHQLQVRVNGWEQVSPVSVDKVGTFFRYAAPDKNSSSSTVRGSGKGVCWHLCPGHTPLNPGSQMGL